MSNPARFSAREIYDLAVQTEINGRVFYEAAAQAAKTPDVQQLMKYLAVAEAEHEATFRQLRDETVGTAPSPVATMPESYPGELQDNMFALLKARVLPDEATGLQAVAKMQDDKEAVQFAIAFEKDTILFMQQMRELIPEAERERVSALLQQEYMHVRLLQEKLNASA